MMGSEREQGHEQQFCLRWHNYQSSLLATLPQLLDGDDLTDVTLCAGGRNLKAHRVVLSACSQYFKELFKEMQPMQHPVIVLPGTDFTDLCALVTFMYSGEVNIYQHQLTSLLAMADTLHIRGLAEFTGAGCLTSDPVKKETATGTSVQRCKRAKVGAAASVAASTVCSSDENIRPTVTPKTKQKIAKTKLDLSSENYVNWTGSMELGNQDQNMAEDLSQRMLSVTDLTEQAGGGVQHDVSVEMETQTSAPTDLTQGVIETKTRSSAASSSKLYATCFVCGKQLSNQYNLRVHMETHQNAYYACSACNHISRSRDALRKHVSYRHPQTPVDSRPRHP